MVASGGRYHLSFNGEIYNYRELRLALQHRWNFKSDGDSEVVLAGLVLEGQDFLNKMNGMWAIIFWDSLEEKLYLSRDRFGKKPLYYSCENGWSVASELPAIKMLLAKDSLTESEESRSYYFRYGYFPSGKTIYQQIEEVLPGHLLVIDCKENKAVSSCYWSLRRQQFVGTRDDALVAFREKFQLALTRRLVSDVEVGVLLSGGIDSSVILSSLVQDCGVKPKAFTLGFSESAYDESQAAASVAGYFGVQHFSQEMSSLAAEDMASILGRSLGQPFGDASILPTVSVAQLASKEVKVCMTGDGADEVFSGYQRYQARLLYDVYFRLPKPFTVLFERILGLTRPSHSHHSQSVVRKAQLFMDLLKAFKLDSSYGGPRVLPLLDEYHYFGSSIPSTFNRANFEGFEDAVMQVMRQDMDAYLPQDILMKSDRASMLSSLELRSPFLDHELVEFAFSLPRNWHRSGVLGKRIVRDAMAHKLPREVWKKRKQGFSVPLGEWFLGDLGGTFMEMLSAVDVDDRLRSGCAAMLKDHQSGKKNNGMALWSFFSYLSWKTEF